LNKETRNAGEKPVHGFMGSLLNPKAAVWRWFIELVGRSCRFASGGAPPPYHFLN
jgi:hypothetical protein